MYDITLTSGLFHNYEGADGNALKEFDKKLIQHIMDVGEKDFGYMQFVIRDVGYYTQVNVNYDGYGTIFTAQETSSGDWWVNHCKLSIDSPIWKYVFKAN